MKINSSSIKGVEFDEKGNIKLPPILQKRKEENEILFKNGKAIKICKNIISPITPLKCSVTINSYSPFRDSEKIKNLFNQAAIGFKCGSELSFNKISENCFEVEIISGRKRCSWCNYFIKRLEKELNIKTIKEDCPDDFIKGRRRLF